MFHGSIVALVTPMFPDGEVDFGCLNKLIDFHLANNTDGLVILGSTGESAGISASEREKIIKTVVQRVKNKLPVIVGTGTNNLSLTQEYTKQALHLGADGALIVTPYYLKPTQDGLYDYFSLIAKNNPLPQLLYNVPGRTATDLLPATVAKLCDVPNIVGIKEATGSIDRLKQLQELCADKIEYFSGDDPTFYEFMLQGGKGVISISANVAPKLMHEVASKIKEDKLSEAKNLNDKLMSLHNAMICSSNPIPVKWALNQMGLINKGIRLPLTELTQDKHAEVLEALRICNAI